MGRQRILGISAIVVLALLIALFQPFQGLAPQGHYVLGVIIVALALWILKTPSLPFMAGCALILGGGLLFRLPLSTLASGYLSSAIWVLIPALYFGFALAKTGLGTRIAYLVLKTFKPSYLSIVVSWFIIGIALSVLTPSIIVRLSIVMPIAYSVVEACKIPDRSRGAALNCMIAWIMAVLPGTAWLTGSLWGPFMMGFYPEEIKPLVTFGAWFQYMAVPWLIITVLTTIGTYIFLKPKEPLGISPEVFKSQYDALGPITRDQVITSIVLTCAMVLFTTEKWHGMSTATVAVLAFFALIMFKIVNAQDISSGVNWDVINFVAMAAGLSAILVKAGISDWVRPMFEPAILSWAATPVMFLLVITIGFWVIRFVDIPWGLSTLALTAPIFIPLFQQFGLHPALVSVAAAAAGNCFFLPYQQPFLMMADAITKSRGWESGHVSLVGVIYAIAVIVAILLSSIYWKAFGLMP